jgi:carbonic anhydrase
MKTFVVFVLLGALSLPLSALAAGDWVGYVTYTPKPVPTTVAMDAASLKWLKDTASRLGPDGFTFLGRRDADHWIAFNTKGGVWVLQVHDASAKFNFRGIVSPKTGKLIVEKGVQWEGLGRQADAKKSATLALEYAAKARAAKDLFSSDPMTPTIGTMSAAGPETMKAPSPEPKKAVPQTEGKPVSMRPKTPAAAASMEPPAPPPMAEMTGRKMMPPQGPASAADLPWKRLLDGNKRFVSGKVTHPDQSMARIEEISKEQKPFAIVLACSDSPAPPEVVFDQGLGDLIVIRTAGEVATDVELGSIEYAVDHLGVPYLVVMGDRDCSIVEETIKGGDLPANIEAVAAQIRPAVEAARFMKGDLLDNAVRENTRNVVKKIKDTPALALAISDGRLNVKAAYYDTMTGKVSELQ